MINTEEKWFPCPRLYTPARRAHKQAQETLCHLLPLRRADVHSGASRDRSL